MLALELAAVGSAGGEYGVDETNKP